MSAVDGGSIIAPHLVPEKTTVTSSYYCDLLDNHTFPNVRVVMGERSWWWQQDGASPHTAKATAKYLKDSGTQLLANWPATSACLNPLDFHVWGVMKPELYAAGKYEVGNQAAIKASALTAIEKFNTNATWKAGLRKRKACLSFRARRDQVAANGGKSITKTVKKKTAAAKHK